MVGGFLGATGRVGDAPRGGATRRVGDAPRRPYMAMWGWHGGVAALRPYNQMRGGRHAAGGRRTAVGDAPRGVGDAPQWATRRVAPTIRYDFWGAASLRPNVASLRPTVASLRLTK